MCVLLQTNRFIRRGSLFSPSLHPPQGHTHTYYTILCAGGTTGGERERANFSGEKKETNSDEERDQTAAQASRQSQQAPHGRHAGHPGLGLADHHVGSEKRRADALGLGKRWDRWQKRCWGAKSPYRASLGEGGEESCLSGTEEGERMVGE